MSLGEALLQRKKITAAQLEQAMAVRKPTERAEHALVRLGFIDERDYLEVYGEQLSIPLIDLSEVEIDQELLQQTPSKVVHRDRVIPIDRRDGTIRVATNNPFNLYAFDELRMLMGAKIETVLATGEEIARVHLITGHASQPARQIHLRGRHTGTGEQCTLYALGAMRARHSGDLQFHRLGGLLRLSGKFMHVRAEDGGKEHAQ